MENFAHGIFLGRQKMKASGEKQETADRVLLDKVHGKVFVCEASIEDSSWVFVGRVAFHPDQFRAQFSSSLAG